MFTIISLLLYCLSTSLPIQAASEGVPLIPLDVWQELEPYFLPDDHPIKAPLDRLFSKTRVTQSIATFEQAGFIKPKARKPTQIILGRHPQFKKYIFKVYLDTQPPLCEWECWIKRIQGARSIQACIVKHGFRHFRVPKKWIYPLPPHPSPFLNLQHQRKFFILVAEKMPILSSRANLKAFKARMSPQRLRELYTILQEVGLIDSVYPDNIPFTKQGHIAFVDTGHHHLMPVPYHRLTPFLSPELQSYWQALIDESL